MTYRSSFCPNPWSEDLNLEAKIKKEIKEMIDQESQKEKIAVRFQVGQGPLKGGSGGDEGDAVGDPWRDRIGAKIDCIKEELSETSKEREREGRKISMMININSVMNGFLVAVTPEDRNDPFGRTQVCFIAKDSAELIQILGEIVGKLVP